MPGTKAFMDSPGRSDRTPSSRRTRAASVRLPAGGRQLVLGVPDPLFELPAVGLRLAALDPLQLRASLLELLSRRIRVDLTHVDRVVDERQRAVLLDGEEAGAGRELADLLAVDIRVDARRAGLEQGD